MNNPRPATPVPSPARITPEAEPFRPKLDLSRLEPPATLEESSIEEITIDGICGVY